MEAPQTTGCPRETFNIAKLKSPRLAQAMAQVLSTTGLLSWRPAPLLAGNEEEVSAHIAQYWGNRTAGRCSEGTGPCASTKLSFPSEYICFPKLCSSCPI